MDGETVAGQPWLLIGALAGFLVVANLLCALAFWLDKRRAVAGEWRIPEATLLGMALAGGWVGAKWAQHRFRHKTRKQPFRTQLNTIGAVHLVAAALLFAPMGDLGLPEVARVQKRLSGLVWSAQDALADMAQGLTVAAPQTAAKAELPRRFGPGSDGWAAADRR
ncbi:DUF1294 domain-containing protein [Paracoccaceae bacterium Fryx2]|nr:DUF1294 domain-containing protein [Paracoccaceae bacterium Fryx2]